MSPRHRTTVSRLRAQTGYLVTCLACLVALGDARPIAAQDSESETAAQQWDQLREQWADHMLSQISKDGSAVRGVAIEYLAANPVKDEAWDDFVRAQLRSESIGELSRGLELLRSTSIPFGERAELIQAALTAAGDRFTVQTGQNVGVLERSRSLVSTRRHHPNDREQTAASQIMKTAERYLKSEPGLYAAVLNPMLAKDQPAPAAFNLLFHHGTANIEAAKRLLKLAESDHEQTAAMASLVMNEVLQNAPTEQARDRDPESDRYWQYASRIVERSDTDKSGDLTRSEWRSMLMDPSPADVDGDGRITVPEYARWVRERSER